jgi:two-component system, NarL family, nitrate/nitrite response regulator NarL
MATPPIQPIRVLLVNGHALVRAGFRSLLESERAMVVVGEAGTAAEALVLVAQTKPEIILFESNLGDHQGLDLIARLIEASSGARLILLTDETDSAIHQQAVRFGAMGVILKTQPGDILFVAIHKVNAGEAWLGRTLVANVLAKLVQERQVDEDDPDAARIASLSDREIEVVDLIGEGMKNKEIAAKLSISESTVRHHLTSIFGKLDVSDRLELIIYAYQHKLAKLPP